MMTFILPFLKSDKASSRCDCLRSPWIDVVGCSDSDKNDAKKSAVRLVSTKTIVPRGSSAPRISISLVRFSNLVTWKTVCLTSVEAPPTTPIVRKMYSCKYFPARRWISLGNVAENMSVWRSPVFTIVGFRMISSTAGANPMSSIRSASSSTKYFKFSNVTNVLSQKSFKRPGVATKMWQPFYENEMWWILQYDNEVLESLLITFEIDRINKFRISMVSFGTQTKITNIFNCWIDTYIEIRVLMTACRSTIDLATFDDATISELPRFVVNLWIFANSNYKCWIEKILKTLSKVVAFSSSPVCIIHALASQWQRTAYQYWLVRFQPCCWMKSA